jgi:hypothetical protein
MLLISEAHFCHQPATDHEDQSRQMKANHRERPLTFGDFVAGVYHTWGKRRGKGIVQLALKAHLIEFCGTERFVISCRNDERCRAVARPEKTTGARIAARQLRGAGQVHVPPGTQHIAPVCQENLRCLVGSQSPRFAAQL